jgi:hypothetical protein
VSTKKLVVLRLNKRVVSENFQVEHSSNLIIPNLVSTKKPRLKHSKLRSYLFFKDDIDEVLRIFHHVSALGYADDLKLFMTIESLDNCHKFQTDLNRLQEWCSSNKFELIAAKCKTISFRRNKKPIDFVYHIGGHNLERVNEI